MIQIEKGNKFKETVTYAHYEFKYFHNIFKFFINALT